MDYLHIQAIVYYYLELFVRECNISKSCCLDLCRLSVSLCYRFTMAEQLAFNWRPTGHESRILQTGPNWLLLKPPVFISSDSYKPLSSYGNICLVDLGWTTKGHHSA